MLGIRDRSSLEPLPGALLQEPQGRVERRAPPHLQRKQLRRQPGVSVGDGQHVVGPHARRQQRLMRVAQRRVGDQQPLLFFDPLAEALRSQLLQLVARPRRRRTGQVQRGQRRRLAAHRGGRMLDVRMPVDDHPRKVIEQLGRPILPGFELKQLRRVVDEPGREAAGDEPRVRDQVDQKRNVGLHAADAEFLHARSIRRVASGNVRAQAVTLTSSES